MYRYCRYHSAARRPRRGFTLLEVLIVLAILGVIAAMVVPRLLGQQRVANEKATRISIEGIESALELLRKGDAATIRSIVVP